MHDRRSRVQTLLRIWSSITAMAVAGVLVLAGALVAVPKLTGGMSLTVLTGSMEPGIQPGDVVVTRGITPENIKDLRVGDVIAFLPFPDDPTLVTHRIVQVAATKDGPGFITKGDANDANDPWGVMTAKQVRGALLFSVPKVGYVRAWLGDNTAPVTIVAAIVLLAYAAITFGLSLRKPRADAPEPPADVPESASPPTPDERVGAVVSGTGSYKPTHAAQRRRASHRGS